MTEEQFRVYLLHPDGSLRSSATLRAVALMLWVGLADPEELTDLWMEQWSSSPTPAWTAWIRRESGGSGILPTVTRTSIRLWHPIHAKLPRDIFLDHVCAMQWIEPALLVATRMRLGTSLDFLPADMAHEMTTQVLESLGNEIPEGLRFYSGVGGPSHPLRRWWYPLSQRGE